MTKEDAKEIKYWRVAMGKSWRRIAELAAEKWPERDYIHGNQLQGIDLCDDAMITLGETVEDGWN